MPRALAEKLLKNVNKQLNSQNEISNDVLDFSYVLHIVWAEELTTSFWKMVIDNLSVLDLYKRNWSNHLYFLKLVEHNKSHIPPKFKSLIEAHRLTWKLFQNHYNETSNS